MRNRTMGLILLGVILTTIGAVMSPLLYPTWTSPTTYLIFWGRFFIAGIAPLFFGFILIILQFRYHKQFSSIVSLAKSYDERTLEELSKESGHTIETVRRMVIDAISAGELKGSIRGESFVRATGTTITVAAAPTTVEKPVETAVEREAVGTRRVPDACFKCGVNIKPDEVSWLGPDSVECPHCGATMKVTT